MYLVEDAADFKNYDVNFYIREKEKERDEQTLFK